MTDKARGAINALLDYRQTDEEGVFVLTSRQAIHEVVEEISSLEAQRDALKLDRASLIERLEQATNGMWLETNREAARHFLKTLGGAGDD